MGTVIDFAAGRRLNRESSHLNEEGLGTVIILPVVRVERSPNNPDGIESGTRNPSGRKRRRRVARS